jgi:phosphatidylinositol kinase/protein kinase (PI-3  family)
LDTLEILIILKSLCSICIGLAILPDHDYIVAVTQDRSIYLWNNFSYEFVSKTQDTIIQKPSNIISSMMYIPTTGSLFIAGNKVVKYRLTS